MAVASLSLEPSLNISISAYRVLFVLLMLTRYRSLNMAELNRHLSENPLIGRGYNAETLTKYVNTLREVGCAIPRCTSRNDYEYELLKSPFSLNFQAEEKMVMKKLLDLLALQPDELLFQGYQSFLRQLEWCMSDENGMSTDGERTGTKAAQDSSFNPSCQKLSLYRQYCQDAFTLQISYRQCAANPKIELESLPLESILLEPQCLLEKKKRFFLMGLDRKTQEVRLLDLEHIASAQPLPSKNRRQINAIIVTFALYGRLASSYRLYPGERIIYQTEEELHIKTKVPETSELMSRLLKYGSACQVLSPQSFRQQMKQHIERLLSTLQATPLIDWD